MNDFEKRKDKIDKLLTRKVITKEQWSIANTLLKIGIVFETKKKALKKEDRSFNDKYNELAIDKEKMLKSVDRFIKESESIYNSIPR